MCESFLHMNWIWYNQSKQLTEAKMFSGIFNPENIFIIICGHLCGQNFTKNFNCPQKLEKSKENTRNPKISGVFCGAAGRI